MAKVIKRTRNGVRVRYEESDPIYSEGWTIGSVTPLRRFTKSGKTPDTETPREKEDGMEPLNSSQQ